MAAWGLLYPAWCSEDLPCSHRKGEEMYQRALASVVCLALVGVAGASVPSPRSIRLRDNYAGLRDLPVPRAPHAGASDQASGNDRRPTETVAQPQATGRPARSGNSTEYRLTAQTEITLDGKPCKFSTIPASAKIIQMEVAADGHTVLRVHFRSTR
jgi:hypothetical protein